MATEFYVNSRGRWSSRNLKYLRPARWALLFFVFWIFLATLQMVSLETGTKQAEATIAEQQVRYNSTHPNKVK